MSMGAYSDPKYLASLVEFGEPVRLPESGAGLLIQAIPSSNLQDARGAYPLFACSDWDRLPDELERLDVPWVSIVAIPDPFTAPPTGLVKAFPDLCRPYKDHLVVRMRGRYEGPWPEGHRRNLRKAAQTVEVERVSVGQDAIEDWLILYAELCARRSVSGIAAFSEHAFRSQFAIPSLRIYRATVGSRVVGMALWLREGDRAYYHLGTANGEGRESGAMFALFDQALNDFAHDGIERVHLGAGAGIYADANDGLARFKTGWANESVQAYLCGRILDRQAYADLSNWHESDFFPAYRCPEFARAAR